MQTREFGPSRVPLSSLSFGSMRLDPNRTSKEEALRLFETLHDGGLTTFHSSYEYDSFDYFTECLASFRETRPGADLQHIVKVPAPHFDESHFSAAAFRDRIDRYLTALEAERLDVVQWLIRQTPNTFEKRSQALDAARDEISEVCGRLRKEGKVGAFASFPYDPAFAHKTLDLPICEGLVTYLNFAELEYVPLVEKTSFVAIRPLLAGLLTPGGLRTPRDEQDAQRKHLTDALEKLGVSTEDVTSFAIQFTLMHENVASTIVGISSISHARELLDAERSAHVDTDRFHHIVDALSATQEAAC